MKQVHARAVIVVFLGVLSMAPTAGDVGGCGAEVTALDRDAFARVRKATDCERCQECGLGTARCLRSCDPQKPPETNIPSTCEPLLHDGEVCIRALRAVSCASYATYVADFSPSTPSECEFCRSGSAPSPALAVDASTRGRTP